MSAPVLAVSRRTRSTPFTPRVEALGVAGYTVYNHMLLATSFRGVEADYHHLKSHVQLWDVGCERQVEVQGPDAARLVQLMTVRDLSTAQIGQGVYAPLVDVDGGMVNDPVVLKLADDRFWLSVADSDVWLWAKGLASGLGLDAAVSEPDVWPLAIQGPKADDLMAAAFGDSIRGIRFFGFQPLTFKDHDFIVARSGWSKQGGFEIYVDRADLALDLWDFLWAAGQPFDVGPGCPNMIERIEGGLLSYGNDMTLENNPLECGLDRYCHLEGTFDSLGRDAVAKIRKQGIRRVVRGLRIEGAPLTPCVQPWTIHDGSSAAGQVTSAAWSPDFGCNVAFAMLNKGFWTPGQVVQVNTLDGERSAVVSELPFSKPEQERVQAQA